MAVTQRVALINEQTIKSTSYVQLNVDGKMLSNAIIDTQFINLRPVLGDQLYQDLLAAVITQSVTPIPEPLYKLLVDYVHPYLTHTVIEELLMAMSYRLSNKGPLQYNDTQAGTLTSEQLRDAKQWHGNKATSYKQVLIRYLVDEKYIDGLTTDKDTTSEGTGWFIAEKQGCGNTVGFTPLPPDPPAPVPELTAGSGIHFDVSAEARTVNAGKDDDSAAGVLTKPLNFERTTDDAVTNIKQNVDIELSASDTNTGNESTLTLNPNLLTLTSEGDMYKTVSTSTPDGQHAIEIKDLMDNTKSRVKVATGSASMEVPTDNLNSLIEVSRSDIKLNTSDVSSGDFKELKISAVDGMVVTDSMQNKGLEYATNYVNGNLNNPRWIPDKAYVDNGDNLLQTYVDESVAQVEINLTGYVDARTPFVTPEMFGAIGDGVADDGDAINAAIQASNGATVLLHKSYFTTKIITLLSGVTVHQTGSITSSEDPIVNLTGVNNVKWVGGTIVGDSGNLTQEGFLMVNASNNCFDGLTLINIPNKGFSVGADTALAQSSKHNRLSNLTISGSDSSSGGGISLFGDGCIYNVIESPECFNNRIGITLNGAHYNTIENAYCHDNWLMGLTVDGIISLTGDGGKYNTIIAPVCNTNGDSTHSTYGGIYLGNGSSYNNIVAPVCKNNFGAGMRLTGLTDFNNTGNKISNFLFEGNGVNGLTVSGSGKTIITGGVSQNNTGRGIAIFTSDDCHISNVKAYNNTSQGVIVQSLNCIMSELNTSGNLIGVRVATGGSPVGDGNVLFNSKIADGIQSDNNLLHIFNESGSPNVVLADVGDANFTFLTQNEKIAVYNTPITATRTVSLSATGAKNGDRATVVRTALATGAFNVNVGSPTIKALSAGEYVNLVFNGVAWVQCGFGALGVDPKYILNQAAQQNANINISGILRVAGATTTLEGDVILENAAFRALQMYRKVNALNAGNPVRFYNDDLAGTKTTTVQLLGAMSDNTAGAISSYFAVQTTKSGVAAERFRITADGNILIATTADITSSKFTVNSTTQGVLLPRMTNAQVLAIVSPAAGLEVYNTTLNKKCFFNGTAWEQITSTLM